MNDCSQDHGLSKPTILIAGIFDATGNGGAARRVRHLAQLFASCGLSVQFVGLCSTDFDETLFADLGDSIRCHLVRDSADPATSIVRRLFGSIGGAEARHAALEAISGLLGSGLCKCVLLYNQDIELLVKLGAMCRRHGAKMIVQFAELHKAKDYKLGVFQGYWIREMLHAFFAPRRADASVAISSFLAKWVAAKGGRNILVLPAFVDVAEWNAHFLTAIRRESRGRCFVYVGAGSRRDCLDAVVKGFAIGTANEAAARLCLVGLRKSAKRAINRLAGSLRICTKIEVLGRMSPVEIAGLYLEADACFLLRSDDRSSWACFPTRLGEFLLSSRPVILSDIPDYNTYFKHRRDAFLVKPGNVESIAVCVREILSDPELCREIGENGRRVALERFDFQEYGGVARAWFDALMLEGRKRDTM